MSAGGRAGDFRRGVLWTSPWIIGFILFLALPIGLSFYYSLTEYSLLEPAIFIGLENYRELFNDPLFWTTLHNTGFYTLAAVSLGTVVSIGLALLLNRQVRGTSIYRAIVFLPSLVPLVAAALGFMWLFNGEVGLINSLLRAIGIEQPPDWLGTRGWAMWALIVTSLWTLGGSVVIYLAALQDVPDALYEAAEIDGVGPARRFLHVTLPMISPAVLFNVVMSMIWSIQIFAVPYIMTEGGPDDSTRFYTMYLYDNAFVYGRMGYASAMAWLQIVLILIITGVTLLVARRFVYYRAA